MAETVFSTSLVIVYASTFVGGAVLGSLWALWLRHDMRRPEGRGRHQ